jgi:hypothetical protein
VEGDVDEEGIEVVRDLRAFKAERLARLLGLKWVMSRVYQ